MQTLFHSYDYTSLVTVLAVFITLYFMGRVGLNRGKMKVNAPKTSGNEAWEILNRIHLNTIEQMILFLPSLWLAAVYSSDRLAAGIGAVWLVGRLVYSYLYLKNPKKRGPGMLMTGLPTIALAVIALYQIVKGLR